MGNKYINTIIFVSDLKKSKKFYSELLGIRITKDLETIVFFENHLVLHCAESIITTVYKGKKPFRPTQKQEKNNLLNYFECENLIELETFFEKIKDKVKLIHPIETQKWGQNVFRFYDPDGHIVEFGEPMNDTPEIEALEDNIHFNSAEPEN